MYDFSWANNLPDWLHTAYITDWAMAGLFYGLSRLINSRPVFERDFVVDDSLINHRHTQQRVNHGLLNTLALYIPYLAILAIGGLKRSFQHAHHGFLSLSLAVCAQDSIVVALKNRVGRLRPDFLARCKWDESMKACTGNAEDILDGRRSFPSGHSSLAFAGLTFLSLLLGSHICTFSLHSTLSRPYNLLRSRPLRLFIALTPLGVATWVAVTRLEDYRHHKEDVMAGGLIGAVSAYVSYTIYWNSPFSGVSGPRNVYSSDTTDPHPGYELTQLDDPPSNV